MKEKDHKPRNKGHKNKKSITDKSTPSQGPSEKAKKLRQPKPSPSVDEDGFWSVEGQKRARPVSPESNTGLPTKNIYSVLEEASPAKKKASKESPVDMSPASLSGHKSQSPNVHMEVDNPQKPGIQEKTRIPLLDRKLSRGKISSTASSQSKGKTGNTKFQL